MHDRRPRPRNQDPAAFICLHQDHLSHRDLGDWRERALPTRLLARQCHSQTATRERRQTPDPVLTRGGVPA